LMVMLFRELMSLDWHPRGCRTLIRAIIFWCQKCDTGLMDFDRLILVY
jgi:hypothetical protein